MKSLHESILSQMGMGGNSPVLIKSLLPLEVARVFLNKVLQESQTISKVEYGVYRQTWYRFDLYISLNANFVVKRKSIVYAWIWKILSDTKVGPFIRKENASFSCLATGGTEWVSVSAEENEGEYFVRISFKKDFFDSHKNEFKDLKKSLKPSKYDGEVEEKNL